MATTRSNSRANTSAREEVLSALKEDHKRVKKAFKAFEKLDPDKDSEECATLVEQTCAELKLHTEIEEEILYPAAREALPEADLVDEAEVEHMTAKQLIEQLEGMTPDDEKYRATFTVLGEYVQHHVKEEEGEMFPQLEDAKIDWQDVQTRILQRREELAAELMPASEDEEDDADEADQEPSKPAGAKRAAKSKA
jgi:hypothetical protein